MNTAAQEFLRLKMAGLVLLALGFVAAAAIGESVGDGGQLLAAPLRQMARLGAAWMGAAYLLSIGLIVLLAGLHGVPLLTSARARRGALQKLAGATLLILCLAFVAVTELPAFQAAQEAWWITLSSLIVFIAAARMGIQLLRSGWKYDAESAAQLLATDARPPVIYLRSFEADGEILLWPGGFWRKAATACFDYLAAYSPEQELAEILNRVGPVIAIGKPGEPLPELGAARLYVDDADWQAKVLDMLARSRLVIIRAGATPNLQWEIEQAMARVPRRQVVFVSLGDAGRTVAFDRYFEQRFGRVLPSAKPATAPLWVRLLLLGRSTVGGRIIYFDDALQPREEPIRPAFSVAGLLLGIARPHRDPMRAALKRVFEALALPWAGRSSQTMAVLLAMFGGIFGLHHFYLGERKRGFWHLVFFWTAIPMLVGWYDTVRLARLAPQAFAQQYAGRRSAPS